LATAAGASAPLHTDITVVPFSSVPLEGLTYADLEQFLQALVAQHLAEGGPLQFRVQQQVLRSAREVAPVILRSSIISNAYDDLPAIAAPERAKTCTLKKQPWTCWNVAARQLLLIESGPVRCVNKGQADRFRLCRGRRGCAHTKSRAVAGRSRVR
jgi:hypothetical protein